MDSHAHGNMPSVDLESAQGVVVSSHPVNTTTNVQDTSSSSSTHAATHVSEQHTLTPQAQPCGLLEPSQNTANNTASAYLHQQRQRQQHSPPSSPTKEAELPGLVASTLDLLGDRVDETTLTPSMTEFLANPKVVAKLCEFVAQKRTETGEFQDQSAAVTITRARRAAQLLSEPPRPIAQVVLRRAGPTAVTLCRLVLPVEQNHGGDAANRCTAPAANAVGALLRRAPRQVVRSLDEAGLVPQLLASVDVAPWADGLLRAFEAMLSTLASVITQQRRAATAAAGGAGTPTAVAATLARVAALVEHSPISEMCLSASRSLSLARAVSHGGADALAFWARLLSLTTNGPAGPQPVLTGRLAGCDNDAQITIASFVDRIAHSAPTETRAPLDLLSALTHLCKFAHNELYVRPSLSCDARNSARAIAAAIQEHARTLVGGLLRFVGATPPEHHHLGGESKLPTTSVRRIALRTLAAAAALSPVAVLNAIPGVSWRAIASASFGRGKVSEALAESAASLFRAALLAMPADEAIRRRVLAGRAPGTSRPRSRRSSASPSCSMGREPGLVTRLCRCVHYGHGTDSGAHARALLRDLTDAAYSGDARLVEALASSGDWRDLVSSSESSARNALQPLNSNSNSNSNSTTTTAAAHRAAGTTKA
ncbi:hypothetical protein RI054_04g21020 [Pseudoscourfieldia marina]